MLEHGGTPAPATSPVTGDESTLPGSSLQAKQFIEGMCASCLPSVQLVVLDLRTGRMWRRIGGTDAAPTLVEHICAGGAE